MRAILCAVLIVAGCSPAGTMRTGGGDAPCPTGCQSCTNGICYDCAPNQPTCSGGGVVACNADGTLGAAIKDCDVADGESCHGGTCLSACDAAASTHSYVGCDYWPVTTLNSQLNPYFDFAVAVANPLTIGDVVQSAPAVIQVTRGGKTIAQNSVAPGTVETIILPWVTALSQPPNCSTFACIPINETSASVTDGAYHLTSSRPVTVYQFNPLQFEKPKTSTCTDLGALGGGATCHSYTNDASILLPTTALLDEYVVIARQSWGTSSTNGDPAPALPGFFAVVATANNTHVVVTSSAHTEPGGGISALSPGQQATYTLAAGQVLQIVSERATGPCVQTDSDGDNTYCDLGKDYDLTGTHITADAPIGLFGGHTCTYVPFDKSACDHLEEMIPPLDTWGQKVIVVQTKPQIVGEPNVFRVVSGSPANMITFDPPSVSAPVMLDTGEYVEVTAQDGFEAIATGRIAIGQYMVGEDYTGNSAGVGDPSLGLGVPVEQYRDNYDFLTPATYTKSFVTVTAPTGAALTLDGNPVTGSYSAIGGSGFGYQYIELAAGAHHLVGTGTPFGITVSGIASYTSYLYVGGQNLNEVQIQ